MDTSAAAPADPFQPSEPTWAVLVIHGVGDTGPGVTMEAFVPPLLEASQGNLVAIEPPEVRLLAETAAAPTAEGRSSHVPLADRLPMHLRRVHVRHPRPGTPKQALFAEVYWADISSTGDSLWNLLLSLFTVVFYLRYISDQAAASPGLFLARALRLLLYGASWLLCGPIAALNGFLLYLLAARFGLVMLLGLLQRLGLTAHGEVDAVDLAGLVLLGTLLGVVLTYWGGKKAWPGQWRLLLVWFTLVGIGMAAWATSRLFLPLEMAWHRPLEQFVLQHLHLEGKDVNAFALHLAVLLSAIHVAFLVLGVVTMLALVIWMLAHGEVWLRWRKFIEPALNAAFGAALLQIGIWVVLVPALGLVVLDRLFPDLPAEDPLFKGVFTSYLLHLGMAAVVGLCAAGVWGWRWTWVKSHAGPYETAEKRTLARQIPRLLIHILIILLLIVVSVAGTLLFLSVFVTRDTRLQDGLKLEGYRQAVAAVTVAGLTAVGLLFRKGLRAWLHILMDIINHFYRERLSFREMLRPAQQPDIRVFVIQQRIEARFRRVLEEVLRMAQVTHLTVVTHSQGTMIAIDVLWMPQTAVLLAGKAVYLVTMGSPFTHLYQHYFPHRYPPLFRNPATGVFNDDAWGRLQQTVQSWVNLYRVDDFIGTHIDGDDPGKFPENHCLPVGGHIGYWNEPLVRQRLGSYLPGS